MSGPRHPSRKDKTEYLVLRRFPYARAIDFPPSLSGGRSPSATPELRQALANYREELAALSLDELLARYQVEAQREVDQVIAKAAQEERERFFNQPNAAANFDHWSKMAHWTLDEAIALSFGKAPELVRWDGVSKHVQWSPFAVAYHQRRELALRAAAWKQLFDPVLPTIFLAWAKRLEFEMPVALIEAVAKRGQIADWQSLYEELKASHETNDEKWQELLEAKDKLASLQQQHIRELELQLANQPAEKSLSTKERETLLKIIIGIARDSYKFDPKAARSPVPQEIANDIAKHGIELDVDTVRKWLKQASDFLPG